MLKLLDKLLHPLERKYEKLCSHLGNPNDLNYGTIKEFEGKEYIVCQNSSKVFGQGDQPEFWKEWFSQDECKRRNDRWHCRLEFDNCWLKD